MSQSDWMACDECARLIGNEEWEAVARRSLVTENAKIMRSMGMSDDDLIAAAARVHEAFRRAYIKERTQ